MINEYEKLKAKALRALARRDHSRQELQQKLLQASEDLDLIKKILDVCETHHWLSESRFAHTYICSRAQKYYGPRKIRYELQQRGVNADIIEQAFTSANIDWKALAEKARQRKFGQVLPLSWVARGKQSQYLYQRGF